MPESLAVLVDCGIIQEVVRPLMSGKEAQIYLVTSGGEERVAKVYKEAQARTFKHRAQYTEGRRTRSSRDQRAINKRTRHGRKRDEAAWRSTEVDMIHRLRDAGVRVPEPFHFVDGVLVMELIKDAAGNPAPRLGDLLFEPREAIEVYDALIAEVVRMLCADTVHGDLSEFNVLMGADGPVVIDFPQSVDPASNQNARRLLLRDVANLHRFLARLAPGARRSLFAEEMWELYQTNRLTPTTRLGGSYKAPDEKTDTTEVLGLIAEAGDEERARREALGEELEAPGPKPLRRVVDLTQAAPTRRTRRRPRGDGSGEGPSARKSGARKKPAGEKSASAGAPAAAKKRRRRRRRPAKLAPAARSEAAPGQQSDAPAHSRAPRRSASAKEAPASGGAKRASSTANRPAKKRSRRRRRPARPRAL